MAISRYGNYEDAPTVGRITPVTDKDAIIPWDLWDPHYTDNRFTQGASDGLTIFVDPEVKLVRGDFVDQVGEGLTYDYSDRVGHRVGHETLRAACAEAAEETGNDQSARFIENMLRHALDDPSIWLGHLRAGVNPGDGYSYKIYGYEHR